MFSMMASTYFAGFLTSLTPCVYPMIPISLGYLGAKQGQLQKRIVFAFVLGQILMFTAMGLLAVQLGEVFGFLSESKYLQFAIGTMLLVFAYYSWKETLPSFLLKLNFGSANRTNPTSVFTALIAGFVSSLVASPCSTPVLGGVLVMISQSESSLKGMALMFMYGVGISTLFMLIGLSLFKAKSLPRSGAWMKYVHKFSVLLLVASAVYFLLK